jgi:hypothetical protein
VPGGTPVDLLLPGYAAELVVQGNGDLRLEELLLFNRCHNPPIVSQLINVVKI